VLGLVLRQGPEKKKGKTLVGIYRSVPFPLFRFFVSPRRRSRQLGILVLQSLGVVRMVN
jgi:hypothetical protein